MVNHELLRDEGILIIRPEGSLDASDFHDIAKEVDPYIKANGKLHGIMIDAESFPGWKDFAALLAHMKFVKDHHRHIEKIAAVSDSSFLAIAPKIASHFVRADVRHFGHSQREEALTWLRKSEKSRLYPDLDSDGDYVHFEMTPSEGDSLLWLTLRRGITPERAAMSLRKIADLIDREGLGLLKVLEGKDEPVRLSYNDAGDIVVTQR